MTKFIHTGTRSVVDDGWISLGVNRPSLQTEKNWECVVRTMAFYLLSKLSYFKNAAFSQVPKTQILSHLRSQNDANFMFPRWVANAGAFCYKLDEVDGGGFVELNASVMKGKVQGKSDVTVGNAKDARSVLSLCKKKRVSDIILFPPKVLEDEGRLHELFEAWMDEFKIYYASEGEKAKRFKNFKYNVFRINRLNRDLKCKDRLTRLSGYILTPFPPPYALDVPHLRSRNDANFMFPRQATNARAFCSYKLDEDDGSGGVELNASVMKGKSDETVGNAEDSRSILSLCKKKRVSDIILFPPEVLEDEGLLHELFEAWLDEFKLHYASEGEKAKRFKNFKYNVFRNNRLNRDLKCKSHLTRLSGFKPGENFTRFSPPYAPESYHPADGCEVVH